MQKTYGDSLSPFNILDPENNPIYIVTTLDNNADDLLTVEYIKVLNNTGTNFFFWWCMITSIIVWKLRYSNYVNEDFSHQFPTNNVTKRQKSVDGRIWKNKLLDWQRFGLGPKTLCVHFLPQMLPGLLNSFSCFFLILFF